jgi:hypothetical protein
MKTFFIPLAAAVLSLAAGGGALAQYEEGANPPTKARPAVVQKAPASAKKAVNGATQSNLAPTVKCKDGTSAKSGAGACKGHGGAAAAPIDRSTAAAPHEYPTSARVYPPARPLRSNDKAQAGTVHKNAPLDQIAGAGG